DFDVDEGEDPLDTGALPIDDGLVPTDNAPALAVVDGAGDLGLALPDHGGDLGDRGARVALQDLENSLHEEEPPRIGIVSIPLSISETGVRVNAAALFFRPVQARV